MNLKEEMKEIRKEIKDITQERNFLLRHQRSLKVKLYRLKTEVQDGSI